MRPLGIADVIHKSAEYLASPRNDFWYWCRRHEQAHKVGEECQCDCDYIGGCCVPMAPEPCINIGPFMSEREARRLTTRGSPYGKDHAPLRMEIER